MSMVTHRVAWFLGLYSASIAALALVAFTIRGILHLLR
jgi:hypothetical protein